MLRQSKFTQQAVAAVSRLAEVHKDGDAWLSAADIAESRNLRKPASAKVLSVLAQEGLVVGFPGPGGGYRLSRPPAQISLWDVVQLFDREPTMSCPYGPGWCGNGDPCPLHDSLVELHSTVEAYLRAKTFDVFASGSRPGTAPSKKPVARATGAKRRSR